MYSQLLHHRILLFMLFYTCPPSKEKKAWPHSNLLWAEVIYNLARNNSTIKGTDSKLQPSKLYSTKRTLAPVMVAIQLALPLALLGGTNYSPVYAVSKELKDDLSKMEIKFFEHDYKKESVEKRIERVEKLVYGEAKTGSEDDRLSALVAAVPDLNSTAPAGKTQDKEASESKSKSKNQNAQSQDNTAPDPSTDYPRVDAIEQVVLGKTFRDEALGKRLDQLELKAYKKVSGDPDLSKRVEHLEKYVQKHYHKSVSQMVDPRSSDGAPPSNTAYTAPAYTGNSGSYGSSGSYGMSPPPMPPSRYGQNYASSAPPDRPPSLSAPMPEQLAWLEQHVYGRTYQNKSLIDRVRALEKTVFPSDPPDTSSSLPMQIKVLVNAVELMHKTPGKLNETASSGGGSNFPSWPPAGSSSAGGNAYGGYATQNQVSGDANQYGGGYGQQNQYQNQGYSSPQNSQPSYNQNYQNGAYQNQNQATANANTQAPTQKRGHPLLKSLAKTLLTVGAVAAGSVLGGGYYGGGYGSPYGYGNSAYGGAYGMNGAYGSGYGSGYRRGVYF